MSITVLSSHHYKDIRRQLILVCTIQAPIKVSGFFAGSGGWIIPSLPFIVIDNHFVPYFFGVSAIFLPFLIPPFCSLYLATTIYFLVLQGVSAVKAFYELLCQSSLSTLHPEEKKPVAPVELCPILKMLYKILITRYSTLSLSLSLSLACGGGTHVINIRAFGSW